MKKLVRSLPAAHSPLPSCGIMFSTWLREELSTISLPTGMPSALHSTGVA
jgi:hypothetical protein